MRADFFIFDYIDLVTFKPEQFKFELKRYFFDLARKTSTVQSLTKRSRNWNFSYDPPPSLLWTLPSRY